MFNKVNLIAAFVLIPFVEVGTTILLTKVVGAVVTYSLFAVSNILGLIILWFHWKKVKPFLDQMKIIVELNEEEKTRRYADPNFQKQMIDLYQFFASVILLLIPGFITDLVAFYLIYLLTRNTNIPTPQAND
ncbi:FxsA family protein [Pantanalinema rosaneae CENA516]|uniref:FxsA family protein n=1 Tax=Pantanalinema rosaneae TaxID=1620701 RepID=UPI003D6E987D